MLGTSANVITWVLETPKLHLLATDADDPDLGKLQVPVRGDGVENQAEVAVLAGFDRSGGDRLGIDIGLAGADKAEGTATL